MSAKRGFLIAGLIGIVLAVLSWFVMQGYRTALIVKFGLIGANNIRIIPALALLAVSLVLLLIGLPPVIKDIKNRSAKKKLKDLGMQYRSKDSGPEEIREQFGLMKEQRPELASKIDPCIAQLNEIEEQLDRFDRLLKINEAESMANAREALEESQHTIICNLKWIINSSVVASEHDQTAVARLGENLSKVLQVNRTLLDKDEEFLLDLADNLSKFKGEGQTFQLDAWHTTISSLNQKSLMG